MRTSGIVLSILGGLGLIIFGIQAIQQTETFSIFGLDIGVSEANWTPIIISGILFIIGLVLLVSNNKANAN